MSPYNFNWFLVYSIQKLYGFKTFLNSNFPVDGDDFIHQHSKSLAAHKTIHFTFIIFALQVRPVPMY